MAGFGIIGEGDASAEIITSTLQDFKDTSAQDEAEPFWFVVGVPGDPTEAHTTILDWLVENEVYHEIIGHPDIDLDSYKSTAAKFTSAKDVHDRVAAVTQADGGTILLVLVGDDPSEEVMAAIEKGMESGLEARDLTEAGCDIIELGEPEEADGAAPDEQPVLGDTYESVGEAADGGDEDAIAALTEAGEAAGLDLSEEPYSAMSWTEFGKALDEAADGEETPEDDAVGFDIENLPDDLNKLKAIAKQSGIELPAKATRTQIKDAIIAKLGKAADKAATAKAAPKGKAASAPAAAAAAPAGGGDLAAALRTIGQALLDAASLLKA